MIKVKKVLVLPSLAIVFLLVACNSTDVTVCLSEASGREMAITFESSDNEITLATTVLRIDINGWNDEEIQEEIEWQTNQEGGTEYEIDGDTLILTQIIGGEELEELAGDEVEQGLDRLIVSLEDDGATCVTE